MEEVYRTRAQACAVHGTKRRVVRWVSLVVCAQCGRCGAWRRTRRWESSRRV